MVNMTTFFSKKPETFQATMSNLTRCFTKKRETLLIIMFDLISFSIYFLFI